MKKKLNILHSIKENVRYRCRGNSTVATGLNTVKLIRFPILQPRPQATTHRKSVWPGDEAILYYRLSFVIQFSFSLSVDILFTDSIIYKVLF